MLGGVFELCFWATLGPDEMSQGNVENFGEQKFSYCLHAKVQVHDKKTETSHNLTGYPSLGTLWTFSCVWHQLDVPVLGTSCRFSCAWN